RKSEVFSTASDNQPSVEINVLQGEREMSRDNRSLGQFHLDGIPAAPRGVPQVEVTFDIDANGILHVSAKDKGTGKEQKITITDNTGLKDEEIDRMVKEAEANAESDKKRRELIETRNQFDSLIYNTEKTLRDNKDKLAEEDHKKGGEAITEARKHIDSEDLDLLKTEMEKLTQVSHDLAQKMYAKADAEKETDAGSKPPEGEAGDAGDAGETKSENDDVVDAEFEDISNKK
ncbi:MAG: Hsp70 family protein, partial [Nitrospinaceae bacterium]